MPICLNDGTLIHYDNRIDLESIVIPNLDDIEYVQFYGVPEITDPSSFEENDNGLFYNYNYDNIDLDYYSFEIYDYYGFHFSYVHTPPIRELSSVSSIGIGLNLLWWGVSSGSSRLNVSLNQFLSFAVERKLRVSCTTSPTPFSNS